MFTSRSRRSRRSSRGSTRCTRSRADVSAAMRPYAAVFKARFTLLLQYRAAALAGFVTQCWWGGIKVMVLAAFFRGVQTAPMTLQQAIDYVWLGQALLTLLLWTVDPDVVRMVRSGDVAYERLRPLDTHAFWYARAGALFRALGLSAWALSAPASVQAAGLFLLSMVLVVALSSAIATLMDIATVATLSERGVNALVGPIVIVFSGSLIALPLYPDWLQPALRLQPFAGLLDTPFRI